MRRDEFVKAVAMMRKTPLEGRTLQTSDGIGYIKQDGIHADFVHFGSIGEGDHDTALKYIYDHPDLRGGVYLGAAGLLNLSYIAAIKPDFVIFADINPLQTLFWDIFIDNLKSCLDLENFLSFLKDSNKRVLEEAKKRLKDITLVKSGCLSERFGLYGRDSLLIDQYHVFRGLSGDSWVRFKTGADHAWLQADSYQYLRQMALDGNMVSLTLDFLDSESCGKLAKHLRSTEFKSGFVYASSIRKFLTEGEEWAGRKEIDNAKDVFWKNIAHLLENLEAYLIEDCTIWEIKTSSLASSPHINPVLEF